MHNFRPDNGVQRRHFGRLQHHRAARGDARRNLADDLVDRPVPRRDQPDYADRFARNQRRTLDILEPVALQHLDHPRQMRRAGSRLRLQRELQRRTHFPRQRLGNILPPLVVLGQNGPQQIQPVLARCPRERRKRRLRGSNRSVHILGTTDGDLRERLLGGRIDNAQQRGLQRIDPGPVHIVLPFMFHAVFLLHCIGLLPDVRDAIYTWISRPAKYHTRLKE